MNLIESILQESNWLNVQLFHTDIFSIDLWTVVQFWIGFSLIILLHALNIRRALLFLILILIAYEIIEILILHVVFSTFITGSIKDQLADIVIGIAGGVLSDWILRWIRKNQHKHSGIIKTGQAIYIALTYSFIWVGFYGYHYNFPAFNSPGINFSALIFWFTGSFLMLQGFLWFRRWGVLFGVLSAWVGYLIVLVVIEYVSHHGIGLHEISKPNSTPIVGDVIHGLPILHTFYMIAPGFLMLMFTLFNWMYSLALRTTYRHIFILPDLRDQSL